MALMVLAVLVPLVPRAVLAPPVHPVHRARLCEAHRNKTRSQLLSVLALVRTSRSRLALKVRNLSLQASHQPSPHRLVPLPLLRQLTRSPRLPKSKPPQTPSQSPLPPLPRLMAMRNPPPPAPRITG